jgi:putative endonuclease
VHEHRERRGSVFTGRYNVDKLVFVDWFPTMMQAIAAEKKIKSGSRAKKIALIEEANPDWQDLAGSL